MKKKSVKKKKKKPGRKLSILTPIRKEKQSRRDAALMLFYSIILFLVLFFIAPLVDIKFGIGFENSLIASFLGVSVIFFLYYFFARRRPWKKVEEPPKWVVKKRKGLGDDFIGMVRFDNIYDKTSYNVSINLNPLFRGKKLSATFLKKAIDFFTSRIDCKSMYADIKPTNIASIKCFEKNNFVIFQNTIHSGSEHYKYLLDFKN